MAHSQGLGSFYDMKRDFASLTAQEALHVAIFIEERNAEIYTQFAELFAEFRDAESLQIAQVFHEMAEEERHHGTMLQERYFERYGTQHCIITEENIRELIEVPKLPYFLPCQLSGAFAPVTQMLIQCNLFSNKGTKRGLFSIA